MANKITKTYGAGITADTAEPRSLLATVSTPERDRDGEIVDPTGIDFRAYLRNPVLGWAHDFAHPAIGKCTSIGADAQGLHCKFQFAPTPFAEEIYQLYKGGFMRAFSIAFIPLEFDRETKTHRRSELLEISSVAVPSNRDALVTAIGKGLRIGARLQKALGLRDEITIEDSRPSDADLTGLKPSDIEAHLTPERVKESLDKAVRNTVAKVSREVREVIEVQLLVEKAIKAAVKERVELAVAKIRGRVI
jgi:HK97 family phage prohead protease